MASAHDFDPDHPPRRLPSSHPWRWSCAPCPTTTLTTWSA